MSDFESALREALRGDVLTDATSLGLYATDASFYQITPVAVAVPVDRDDVRAAVRLAAEHGVAILPRGGGTSLAGQTVGEALVIDLSKHLNRLLEVDVPKRLARLEPGLVRDELNAQVAPHGLHFAPDPATTSRANLGGMIGTNSSGTKSILYGKTIDHVVALTVLLADGAELHLAETDAETWATKAAGDGREGEIYRGFERLIRDNADEIAERFPKTMRRVGGYPLDEFIGEAVRGEKPWNLAKLFVGSEGTLGLVLEATVRLEPLPAATSLVVGHFRDALEAIRAVEPILPFRPSAVEILDRAVLEGAKQNLEASRLSGFLEGDPEAVLLIEFYGDDGEDVARRAREMTAVLEDLGLGYSHPLYLDPEEQRQAWEVRKAGLGLMLAMKGDRKPLAFIEDAAVPLPVLPEYVATMRDFCRQRGVDLAMYAHASVGVLHLRPILDLRRREDVEHLRAIAERSFTEVLGYGGSFSSEHGDGLVRSAFNERFFGPTLYRAFQDVKRLFDPAGLMNPGKIVDAPPIDGSLRQGPDYQVPEREMLYRYRDEGSFAAAVEMCSGLGHCRKTLTGTMCPSYIATRDEEHSTRGRANALRLAMSGQLGDDAFTGERLHEVLDLCLSCKGCKAECPSNVDLAKLKGEFLQGYYDRHGSTLRDRVVGGVPGVARRLAGPLAPLVNTVQKSRLFRRTVGAALGIHPDRQLPTYAREPFAGWWEKRSQAPSSGNANGRRVALFADTYLAHHEPEIGRAAVELLEGLGFAVEVAFAGCCQRPRISHGFLRAAANRGAVTLEALDPWLREGVTVVVCEPSCASALVDDLPDLVDDAELARRVQKGVKMIDVFLAEELEAGRIGGTFTASAEEILIHGHCHQKALFGTGAMQRVLAEVPALRVREVDSGCCGMAGAFGYEREHYDLSRKIAEDRLLPAVRELDDSSAIVACGISCRHQIADLTGRRAVHWVEVFETARAR